MDRAVNSLDHRYVQDIGSRAELWGVERRLGRPNHCHSAWICKPAKSFPFGAVKRLFQSRCLQSRSPAMMTLLCASNATARSAWRRSFCGGLYAATKSTPCLLYTSRDKFVNDVLPFAQLWIIAISRYRSVPDFNKNRTDVNHKRLVKIRWESVDSRVFGRTVCFIYVLSVSEGRKGGSVLSRTQCLHVYI